MHQAGSPTVLQRLIGEHYVLQMRLHDLRHDVAILALAAGEELKVLQEMLGHLQHCAPVNTYTSVLPEVAHRPQR